MNTTLGKFKTERKESTKTTSGNYKDETMKKWVRRKKDKYTVM